MLAGSGVCSWGGGGCPLQQKIKKNKVAKKKKKFGRIGKNWGNTHTHTPTDTQNMGTIDENLEGSFNFPFLTDMVGKATNWWARFGLQATI